MNDELIGVDLGGTKIHAALVKDGKVVNDQRLPTPKTSNTEEIIDALKRTIAAVMTRDVTSLGIGIPGVIDKDRGIIINTQNIKPLCGVHIKLILEKEFNVPVFLNNDANCFVLGEKHFGLGKDYANIVSLTLGTGLGGGIIINGKLYNGKNMGAGEFCSIKYKDHNLEYYCSSQFFKNEYNTTGIEVYNKAQQGDVMSIRILEELGTHLGEAIYTILAAYDPELIIIGGSIANAEEFFIDAIHKVLENFPNKHISENIKIKCSREPNAAVLGAAALVYD